VSYIETDRLILRTWMPGDVAAWAPIILKEEVHHYLAGPYRHVGDVRAWIARQMEEQDREGFSRWPVVRKSDGVLIGRCGLHRTPEGDVEIAWVFDSAVWGQGYAREAANAVLRYALTTLHLSKVYALVDPRNERSIVLVNHLGMRFDRVVRAYRRDMLRYVMTS
jgi:RimJ/RimL family protein N-acetyltransferase